LSSHATVDGFVSLRWRVDPPRAVLAAPFPSPVIADPTFRGPEDSPDGRWHLFAHTIFGVTHVTSEDGVRWSRPALTIRHAMRPFLYDEGGTFYLLYERTRPFRLLTPWLPTAWRSTIECRASTDLRFWSEPLELLAPRLPWQRRGPDDAAVGNPCLVRLAEERYALYFSASLVRLPDCGFDEPLHVGVAFASRPLGPYRVHPEPLLSPRADDPLCNLGAGAIKVLRRSDGFVGLHNGIYRDGDGRSRSAISVLRSPDGMAWKRAHAQPILSPDRGWRRAFVYACDARPRADGSWVLYCNGRDDWHWTRGREAIGRALGAPPGAP
jgi:hypothetical protein